MKVILYFIDCIENNSNYHPNKKEFEIPDHMDISQLCQNMGIDGISEIKEWKRPARERDETEPKEVEILSRYIDESETELNKPLIQSLIKEIYQEACEVI